MQDRALERAKQNIQKIEEKLAADRQRIHQETEALKDQVRHMPRQPLMNGMMDMEIVFIYLQVLIQPKSIRYQPE